MSIKKTAPSIPAKSGLVQHNCTSRNGKDRDYSALFQRVRQQEQKIAACLAEPTEKGKTRMRIALETGIERANVCRRVAQLREQGRIWSCGRHLDSITRCRAEFLTTDKHTCFEHFLSSTEGIWARLQDQRMIDEAQLAIWNYLFEDDFGAGGFYFQEVSEMWPEIQTKIDKERGL